MKYVEWKSSIEQQVLDLDLKVNEGALKSAVLSCRGLYEDEHKFMDPKKAFCKALARINICDVPLIKQSRLLKSKKAAQKYLLTH